MAPTTVTATPAAPESLAVHEAAHAVAALAGGIPVEYVTVDRTADAAGHCQLRESALQRIHDPRSLLALAAQTLAGFAASARLIRERQGEVAVCVAMATMGAPRLLWHDCLTGALPSSTQERETMAGDIAPLVGDARDDWRQACEMAGFATNVGLHPGSFLELGWAAAQALVRERWTDIERVAAALLERSGLTADELRELLDGTCSGAA